MTLRVRLTLTVLITAIPLVGALMWLRTDVERRAVEESLREAAINVHDEYGHLLEDPEEATRWGGDIRHFRERQRALERRARREARFGSDGLDPEDLDPPFRPGRPGRKGRPGPAGRGPQPPPEPDPEGVIRWVFAYDASFASRNPHAPTVPAALRRALGSDGLAGGPCHVKLDAGGGSREAYEILLHVSGEGSAARYLLYRKAGGQQPSSSGELLWASVVLCGALLLAVLFAAGPIVARIRKLAGDVRDSAADRYVSRVPVEGNDEIADLASAFNDAGAELRHHLQTIEQREQALRSFVRNTTHDVMIPLTVLQGDINDLRKRVEKGEPPDRERIVQALEEAHYMGSLLHNLSAVAKLEGGERQLQMHPVDLNALVQRASERHRPMAHMRGIELEYGVPEPILLTRGDLTLIEQAVSNVIQNAVRYNHEGGHVAVILEAPRDRPGTFTVQVIDDGPGIAPEEMERIAERRFRGEAARTRNPEGSGLGLHIARDVADRHGMSLTFRESAYGGLHVELAGTLLAGAEGA